jgi:HK97 family phage major capsid protein
VINDTRGNAFNIPIIDSTSVTAEAHTEGTQPTDDGGKDATFGQKSLGVFTFNTEWVDWSAELNVDSVLNMKVSLGLCLANVWCGLRTAN